jgi:hypothetical protein
MSKHSWDVCLDKQIRKNSYQNIGINFKIIAFVKFKTMLQYKNCLFYLHKFCLWSLHLVNFSHLSVCHFPSKLYFRTSSLHRLHYSVLNLFDILERSNSLLELDFFRRRLTVQKEILMQLEHNILV